MRIVNVSSINGCARTDSVVLFTITVFSANTITTTEVRREASEGLHANTVPADLWTQSSRCIGVKSTDGRGNVAVKHSTKNYYNSTQRGRMMDNCRRQIEEIYRLAEKFKSTPRVSISQVGEIYDPKKFDRKPEEVERVPS